MGTKKSKHPASEEFVYEVVGISEGRLETRINLFEQNIESKLETFSFDIKSKLETLLEHVVDLVGKFKKFDEEQTILSSKSSNHEDRLERLEKTIFKTS